MSEKIVLGTNIAAAKASDKVDNKTSKVDKTPDSKAEVPMVRMSRAEAPRIVGDYNTIDMMEAEDAKVAKVEMWIAKAIGTTLVNNYPNRQWGVQVDTQGQLIVITCPSLSKKKGYFIHMHDKNLKDLQKRAIEAAGEILERYGISRARKFDADILETLDRGHDDEVFSADAAPEDLCPKLYH